MRMEPRALLQHLSNLARDHRNGWSIGSFGTIGESVRGEHEPVTVDASDGRMEVVTLRGGIRIAPMLPLTAIADDTLSADGKGWSPALALRAPFADAQRGKIVSLGPDSAALQANECCAQLFD